MTNSPKKNAPKEAEKKDKPKGPAKVGLFQVYKFGSRFDKLLVGFGLFSSILSGILSPFMALIFGSLV